MHRSRLIVPLVSAFALVACSPDSPSPVAPLASAARAVKGNGNSLSGRYIVSATTGFSTDFTTRVAALGGKVERIHGTAGIATVTNLSDSAAAQVAALPGVSDVEPDMIISLANPVAQVQADVAASAGSTISSVANPASAPRYSWQWNMRAIHADKAWAAGKLGNPAVTVAILDTGIDYDDPDLNGLVDLSRSTSFIPSDDSITTTYFPSRSVISDYHGHGTNVAAQVSSKAAVHAGVSSKTTLIGVKVLSAAGRGSLSAVLTGVLWAADHNADVANMSLGGGFARAGNGQYVKLINKTFDYAAKKGMLVVVAAGNDGSDLDHNGDFYASYCDASHVVCVSAVGPTTVDGNPDVPAYYTNYGRKSVDVAGPGGNAGDVVSLWPYGSGTASYVWSFCSKTSLVLDANGGVLGYAGCQAGNRVNGYMGTSQATPHVAGLAALLVAEDGHAKPDRIKKEIEKSADNGAAPGHSADQYLGRGRIDVARALGL